MQITSDCINYIIYISIYIKKNIKDINLKVEQRRVLAPVVCSHALSSGVLACPSARADFSSSSLHLLFVFPLSSLRLLFVFTSSSIRLHFVSSSFSLLLLVSLRLLLVSLRLLRGGVGVSRVKKSSLIFRDRFPFIPSYLCCCDSSR